ncbi:MAG: hypothetical protein LKI24_11870 [Acidipropionibacterium sp.]|jgi:hypothetical protein|nr:hypothetical protein [Acidipropionibacterium sp.]
MAEPSQKQSGISRRTIVKGAAWAAPAVAMAASAPLAAASDACTPTTSFDGLTVGSSPSSIKFLPGDVTASLSYTSTGQNNDPTPGNTGKVARTNTSPAWNYLEVQMVSPLGKGDSVTVTITLSEPVEGLSLLIHDLDSNSTGGWSNTQWLWQDTVVVNTSGFTYQKGDSITGTGTSTDPFKNTELGDQPIDSGKNKVRLTWSGFVDKVQITYIAGQKGSSASQHIGIGDISYDACVVSVSSAKTRSVNPSRTAIPAAEEATKFDTSATNDN